MFELYDLRNNFTYYHDFYITAKEKSYSDASRKNNVSQSSLTRSIKQIEQNINGSEFYNTLNQGLLKTLQYIKSNISDLRPEFVDSVRK